MLGARARRSAAPPGARTVCDAETLCEGSFWTQVRDIRKRMEQQPAREPKRAQTHSSPFSSFDTSSSLTHSPQRRAQPRSVSPPRLPVCTRAVRIEPTCQGLQADFASLRLDHARLLSADVVEGICTVQKLALPVGDCPAKPAWTWPVAQAPPKHEVPSNALPTQPSPPQTGGKLDDDDRAVYCSFSETNFAPAPRLAGTDSALPGQEEPRANKGVLNYDISLAELPRDNQGLPMWPRVERPTRSATRCVAESDSDWSDSDPDDECGYEPRDAQGLPTWPRFERPVRSVARAESQSDWSSLA